MTVDNKHTNAAGRNLMNLMDDDDDDVDDDDEQ